MIPWHFTPQPAHLPVEQFRDGIYHPDTPEKMEMIHGKPFWNDTQRFHVFGILIENRGREAVEQFIAMHPTD